MRDFFIMISSKLFNPKSFTKSRESIIKMHSLLSDF